MKNDESLKKQLCCYFWVVLLNCSDSQVWWLLLGNGAKTNWSLLHTKPSTKRLEWTSTEPWKWITLLLGGSDTLVFKNLLLTFLKFSKSISRALPKLWLELLFIRHAVHPTQRHVAETFIHHAPLTPMWGRKDSVLLPCWKGSSAF